jgi:acyl dehydratase
MKDYGRLIRGLYFEDMEPGTTWRTAGRTLLESDLGAFVNLTWYTEELFTNHHDTSENAIAGRPVPATMVFAIAEGLVLPSIERRGLAMLKVEFEIKRSTQVGDTLHVHCEVIEARPTSRPDRGLVRTRNSVRNAAGEEVMTYEPLRLIKRRPAG